MWCANVNYWVRHLAAKSNLKRSCQMIIYGGASFSLKIIRTQFLAVPSAAIHTSSFQFHFSAGKNISCSSIRGSAVCCTHAAAVCYKDGITEEGPEGLVADSPPTFQTPLSLLDACFDSPSLLRVHGKILKAGLDGEHNFRARMSDLYVDRGHLNEAIHIIDDMPHRSLTYWIKLFPSCLANKFRLASLGVFSKMLAQLINDDEKTFATILRACAGVKVAVNFIQQIHAKIIYLGFGSSQVVCNPLIDMYCKNGLGDCAKPIFDRLAFKDNVSWVAIISGLSRSGREDEALLLFHQMHFSGIIPTPYVLSSCLSSCTKISFFKLGEQLHALVNKWGFTSEIYVCNALVTLYSRSENLLGAETIFSIMQRRDRVSYNSLISGLAQMGFADRAILLFEKMQLDRLKPDIVTVASVLTTCASVGDLGRGKQLHAYSIKSGMSSDIFIEGSLLDLYVKCSDIETAHKFFLSTETENVVLWNVMLVAYGQLCNLFESFEIYRQMQVEGLIPNQYTYPSILRTCTSQGALDLGEQIHTQVIKTGFQFNVFVCSVLIDMYAKHKKLSTAERIFRRLDEEDIVSWTAMIAGFTQHDFFAPALKLFEEMQSRGIQSDNIGFSSAISACAGMQALNQGRQIHGQSIVNGYSFDISIGNALVCLYARCGRVQNAYSSFAQIDAKDNISWNGLVSGFSQSGYYEESLLVFSRMNQAGIEVNLFTFASVASAAANMANLKQGKQIHGNMLKAGYDLETEAGNVLVTLYAKCGSIDDAKTKFLEMPNKNEISWNAMITGYSQHGFTNEALNLFEEMKRLSVMPNHVTFVGVLSACSHVGLVEEGLCHFKSMNKEVGLVPKTEHYVCIVDLLGRAGLLSRAVEFVNEMPIEADAMVWRTLLSACRVHKNREIGEFAACRLLQLEPEDSAAYVLLSNIYAIEGKWDYRDRMRKDMKDKGVKKEPGRSWIDIGDTVHAFFVGDRLHPLADQIYMFLEGLNTRAAEIGYVQEPYSLWNDLEQEQKDPSLFVHSEKLAVSLGLLSLPSTMPLRVFKNLRICNDCHSWMKFVSEASNRTIVVRDAYRFHHFTGGACSCKDYW